MSSRQRLHCSCKRVLARPVTRNALPPAFSTSIDSSTGLATRYSSSCGSNAAGWNVRIRKFEGEHEFELTYKRRYPFDGATLANTLAMAERDGFDKNESDYDAQVEWGAQGQTLTMSRR